MHQKWYWISALATVGARQDGARGHRNSLFFCFFFFFFQVLEECDDASRFLVNGLGRPRSWTTGQHDFVYPSLVTESTRRLPLPLHPTVAVALFFRDMGNSDAARDSQPSIHGEVGTHISLPFLCASRDLQQSLWSMATCVLLFRVSLFSSLLLFSAPGTESGRGMNLRAGVPYTDEIIPLTHFYPSISSPQFLPSTLPDQGSAVSTPV